MDTHNFQILVSKYHFEALRQSSLEKWLITRVRHKKDKTKPEHFALPDSKRYFKVIRPVKRTQEQIYRISQ